MSGQEQQGKPVVKKRSLSSYLSNVTSRKEELEKIVQKEKEEKALEEKKKIEDQKRLAEGMILEEQRRREREQLQLEIDRKLKQDNTIEQQKIIEQDNAVQQEKMEEQRNIVEQESIVEQERVPKETKLEDKKFLDSNANRETNNKDSINIQKSASSEIITDKKQLPQNPDDFFKDEISEHSADKIHHETMAKAKSINDPKQLDDEKEGNNLNNIDSYKGPLSREKLNLMLGEPDKDSEVKSSEDNDIDSDAATDLGSPVKPRRGRLIRGDKLETGKVPLLNNSDSDLSEIDSVAISSSFLHGDSSPTKVASHQISLDSSPDKRNSHIALPKNPIKQRKGVYRDSGGRTKLQIACDKGKYDVAKRLIEEEGYDVDDQDNAGNSSLHEAALNGHLDIVKLLIKHGANVNIKSYEMFQDTPLVDASANGHLDVVQYLLDHGADPTITNAKGVNAYEALEEDSDLEDSERKLVRSVKKCLRDATKKWRAENLNRGETSGHSSDLNDRLSPNIKRTEASTEPLDFFWTDLTTKSGKEKLFRAAKEGRLAYIGQYLENGGRTDIKAFFEAVKFGHEDIASLFLAFGAQVNKANKENTTALMVAVGRDNIGTVKLLLEAGADPTKKDKRGHTALFYAKNSILGLENEEEIQLLEKAFNEHGGKLDEPISTVEATSKKTSNLKRLSSSEIVKSENMTSLIDEPIEEQNKQQTQEEKEESGVGNNQSTLIIQEEVKKEEEGLKEENQSENGRKVNEDDNKSISRHDISSSDNLHNHFNNKRSPSNTEFSDGEMSHKKQKFDNKIHEETAEMRQKRLKAEEEYIQRRLQNKKKKEQELLQKLKDDEQKRVEEKEKQKIEEANRLKELSRQREVEHEKMEKEKELSKRRQIRTFYPFGLKLINFNEKDDYEKFTPLYYIMNAGKRFVLDLQMLVILKDPEILKLNSDPDSIAVEAKHIEQIWNMLKFIFLLGGSNNEYHSIFHSSNDISGKIKFELTEFEKFEKLSIHWINWANIKIEDNKRQTLQSKMVEISLLDGHSMLDSRSNNQTITHINNSTQVNNSQPDGLLTSKHNTSYISSDLLPVRFQHRVQVTNLLHKNPVKPLW